MMKLSWLEAGTLTQSFSFFLKSCSSKAIFPTLTIFIPVERSPSMDCITSDRAGFMTQSRVSFILRAGWSTEKDGFAYRDRLPHPGACRNMVRGHLSWEALLRGARKGPCKSPGRTPLFLGRHPLSGTHVHPLPLPHCTYGHPSSSDASLQPRSRSCPLPHRCTGVSPSVCA